MGNPKRKWSIEEEEVLGAGVAKYGPGKWRMVLADPDFWNVLASRSNIDLKDKWRNMSIGASGQGSRDRVKTPIFNAHPHISSPYSEIPSPLPAAQDASTSMAMDPSKSPAYEKSAHRKGNGDILNIRFHYNGKWNPEPTNGMISLPEDYTNGQYVDLKGVMWEFLNLIDLASNVSEHCPELVDRKMDFICVHEGNFYKIDTDQQLLYALGVCKPDKLGFIHLTIHWADLVLNVSHSKGVKGLDAEEEDSEEDEDYCNSENDDTSEEDEDCINSDYNDEEVDVEPKVVHSEPKKCGEKGHYARSCGGKKKQKPKEKKSVAKEHTYTPIESLRTRKAKESASSSQPPNSLAVIESQADNIGKMVKKKGTQGVHQTPIHIEGSPAKNTRAATRASCARIPFEVNTSPVKRTRAAKARTPIEVDTSSVKGTMATKTKTPITPRITRSARAYKANDDPVAPRNTRSAKAYKANDDPVGSRSASVT